MQAYKGTTVHGFPNLFFVVGPNTGLGHSSMVFMIESQVAYVLDAIAHLRATASPPSSRAPRRRTAWNDDLQRRMRRTVWSTGGLRELVPRRARPQHDLWPRTRPVALPAPASSAFDVDAYDDGQPDSEDRSTTRSS